ncbi:SURF1 family cytochrome oxidase biogenesis protein [Garicola koreensis]|uniref:SURF1-like protein n=1 Tax=Garicola koreensis TaxID=1262554 RepID=A0A7W5TSE4_9MICC|nr:cytochrome oxidase assembly protein ShyY1 [Garicola koreensis]
MLHTARQPKWIAMLVLALVLSTVFVVLSAWQFDQSTTDEDQIPQHTEEPVALTEIYEPARGITMHEADRIVELRGEFVADTQVMVADRLQDDVPGYWAVAAFRVDGAPDGEVIPVVRGWSEDYDDAGEPPAGELDLQGRLLPTEAPGPAPRDQPVGVLPSLSVAELINLWEEDSYSGFVVDFSGAALGDSGLEPVWVDPQPEPDEINWLNLFYGLEWFVFAGFAFYLWWRLVKDAHLKELEEQRLDREWEEQWRREQLAKLQSQPDGDHSETDDEPKDPPRD